VKAEIGVGMGFGIGGDLSEPRAWDDDAGGSDSAAIEGVEAGCVLGVRYREVVGVDDQELRIAGIAQALGNGF